jgi:hypothetical protein
MATKAKSTTRSRRRGANADDARAAADRGTRADQRAIREREGDVAAENQRQTQAARDAAIQENDQVVIDLEGVPEALKNSALQAHLDPLHRFGAHGRTGRVARVEQTSDGVFYHVEGPQFGLRVPAAAVKRADNAQAERSSGKRRAAKKKSTRKKK